MPRPRRRVVRALASTTRPVELRSQRSFASAHRCAPVPRSEVGWIEQAAINAIGINILPKGKTTVSAQTNISHVAPTPVGVPFTHHSPVPPRRVPWHWRCTCVRGEQPRVPFAMRLPMLTPAAAAEWPVPCRMFALHSVINTAVRERGARRCLGNLLRPNDRHMPRRTQADRRTEARLQCVRPRCA
jgi:hypothetical protein